MMRYYFHTADRNHGRDEIGVEFPDDAAARLAAIRFAGEVLAQHPENLLRAPHWCVEVTDAHDDLLFTVFAAGIQRPGGKRDLK